MTSTAKRILNPLTLFLCSLPLHAEITATKGGNNLKIDIDGKPFTEYRSDTWVPCLYPLMSPDGTHLTRQFPFKEDVVGEAKDHPHHIGFWFTHGNVNGSDFWHGGKDGSKIVTKKVSIDPIIVDDKSKAVSTLTFTADLEWLAKGKTPILSEKRSYTIQTKGKTRIIDVTCSLSAITGDVVFGDTKEGSFGIRTAPTIRLKGEVAKGGIINSEGVKDGDAWGKRAKWVAFHGPDSAGTQTVIALIDHKQNLRHPTWWHARDYGLLTANPFGPKGYKDKKFKGKGDYTLKNGETLTQKYRLVLQQGDLDSVKLDGISNAFNK
ncbi:MAG: PmoA family protein [Akkermansiaceae bacterium]